MARRSWWGWGNEGEGLTGAEVDALRRTIGERFGLDGTLQRVPRLDELDLRRPRLVAPESLRAICASDVYSRASHSYGKSYRDLVRALAGRLDHPPDLVVTPRSRTDIEDVLDWCSSLPAAVIPFGGGSSVVGGVEPDVGDAYEGAVSLDLTALDRVLEVDEVSLAARIEAGVLGPAMERQLRAHRLTLRHFPQSFEFSTLGGWIATRSGGHFATGPTHIDDLVESMCVVTPAGTIETRRLPASGAGPSPDRLFMGSEGALGVVTEAWMRLRSRPLWRSGGTSRFETFVTGAQCVRALAQSGLMPSNCRLIDPLEALVNGVGDGGAAILVIGFESADHPQDDLAERARELIADHGGVIDAGGWGSRDTGPSPAQHSERRGGSSDAADAWRSAFLRAPYVRDVLVRLGVLCDTFETSVTWDRFEHLHSSVMEEIGLVLRSFGAGAAFATCRLTHAYPDGAAPYFTVLAPTHRGAELERWHEVKRVMSDAFINNGGSITHHHAVGRDHRPWYDRQRPPLFARALQAAKTALDPAGICNPGVLLRSP